MPNGLRAKLISLLQERPRLYDFVIRWVRRGLVRDHSPAYLFLDGISKAKGGRVKFVQIGSNDGLRRDSLREFVVRDPWEGVLVEPLPTVFEELKENYGYVSGKRKLAFENVAVSSTETSLPFFTMRPEFLATLSTADRSAMLRKCSFNRHLVEVLTEHPEEVIQMDVPCVTVAGLVEKHFADGRIDLLMIDAEGHEATILKSIDFEKTWIESIFFETWHLGDSRDEIFALLRSNGYALSEDSGDAFASKAAGARSV